MKDHREFSIPSHDHRMRTIMLTLRGIPLRRAKNNQRLPQYEKSQIIKFHSRPIEMELSQSF
jgi:hypothetical protein